MNFPSLNVFTRSSQTTHRPAVRVPREHADIVRAGYRGECAECKEAADAYVAAFDQARVTGRPDPSMVAFNAHAAVYGRADSFKEEMLNVAVSAGVVLYAGVTISALLMPNHILAGCATSLAAGIGINVASLVLHNRAAVPDQLRGVVLPKGLRSFKEPTYKRGIGYVPRPIRDEDLVTI